MIAENSDPEENSNNVTFYCWKIVEKKITKSKVYIYIKKRQINAYH